MERILKAISDIYDVALDEFGWNRLSALLANDLGARSSALHLVGGPSAQAVILGSTAESDAQSKAAYQLHYHRVDPWVVRGAHVGINVPVIGQELVADRQIRQSKYYNDWGRRVGIFNVMGGRIMVSPGVQGIIALHRPEGAEPFEVEASRRLGVLLPHLGRAIAIQRRLGGLVRDRRIALDALDSLTVGVILADGDGRLLFANARADRHLRAGRGIVLRDGRLAAEDRRRDPALRRAIHAAGGAGRSTAAGGMLALPRPEGRPLSVMICPASPEAVAGLPAQPLALVFIGDNDDGLVLPAQIFAAAHGLSPAESRLAAALVEGGRLEDYAERAQVTVDTARTQLKRIFAKTGCRRQGELIRTALADPIVRMAGRRHLGV